MGIVFRLFIAPLSRLPLSVLFRISDVLYVVLYYIIGYRKKVVRTNIANSFPTRPLKERLQIERDFYQHFCDLIFESIRLFQMPQKELLARCTLTNPSLIEHYAAQGRNLIFVAGHYGNWEIAVTGCNPQIPHQLIAIYKPLSSRLVNQKLLQSRSRFGMALVPKKKFKEEVDGYQTKLHALVFANDQAPSSSQKVYWTEFLHQQTAVQMGTEVYAKRYNYVVLMGKIKKVKRGYHEITFEVVSEYPNDTPDETITEQHTRILEQQILDYPAHWLWTHRRWKMTKPSNA
ncbi:MAG: lipid A biosynthesis acyltransferase [Saprospiraceae bacterium]|nr:lipid A biosynthesis acyltransferase [Saprospiraceae bacterium]